MEHEVFVLSYLSVWDGEGYTENSVYSTYSEVLESFRKRRSVILEENSDWLYKINGEDWFKVESWEGGNMIEMRIEKYVLKF